MTTRDDVDTDSYIANPTPEQRARLIAAAEQMAARMTTPEYRAAVARLNADRETYLAECAKRIAARTR